MNNKITGLRFVSVLLPALVVLGSISLSGCSSSKPAVHPEFNKKSEQLEVQRQVSEMMAPDYPEHYVVVKGDTLWGISKRFLKDPWKWPSVWHVNPKIRNPHLIYPGDIIYMYIVDGKIRITLEGEAGAQPKEPTVIVTPPVTPPTTPRVTPPVIPREKIKPGLRKVRLSPTSRTSGIHKAIPTISMNAIRPFLDRPRLVTKGQLDDAAYIVSSYEQHLLNATGNRIYARDIDEPRSSYNIVRPGKKYIDPDSGGVLGYEAIYLGVARFVKMDEDEDIATLIVTKASREIHNHDVLIPHEEYVEMFQFTPRAPETEVEGQIMSVFNGITLIAQHMVVVLNRGKEEGLAPGHVLAVMQKGARVHDPRSLLFSNVDLPDERAGIMMVFKTYENLSYALIMEANRSLRINDRFKNP